MEINYDPSIELKKLKCLNEQIDLELFSLLSESEKFHGHLGPFLVIGARAGLFGLKELMAKRGEKDIKIKASLKNSTPFTCVLDGLQISTGCTFGNKRLSFENSNGITIDLENKNGFLNIVVNEMIFEELKENLSGRKIENEKLREMAYEIAQIDEDRLFVIKHYH